MRNLVLASVLLAALAARRSHAQPINVTLATDSNPTVPGELRHAIEEANRTEYGLTAGIFSENSAEVETFFDRIEAGVTYANRRSGATTGAWPGVNPFCGWKASGSTGKGVCGPYYVSQFLREQSRTLME